MSGAAEAWQRATLTAVSALGAELSSSPRDADDAVLLVCRRSRDLLRADVRFWLGSPDRRHAHLTVHAAVDGVTDASLGSARTVHHEAVLATLRYGVAQMVGTPGLCRTLLLPVAGRTGTVGVLEIAATDDRTPFDASDVATGAALAERLASSLLTTQLLDELQHRADHDDLTGLPNRAMLVRHLDTVLARAATDGDRCAVVFIDIDRFKLVNDSLGHSAGDEVLRAVSLWLREQVRAEDFVSRFGGDEFVVVASGFQDDDELYGLLDRITRVPGQALRVGAERLYVALSAGLARQEEGDDADTMLRHADAAMYHAKSSRARRWEPFSGRVSDASVERLRLEADLQDAIDRDEIFCEYQPIVSLATGEVVAHEALARWLHPTRGRLEPASFIPLAEDSGIVLPLTDQVLDLALAAAATWPEPVALAVNLSARHLADPRLAHAVLAALQRHRVPPRRLIVEITETAVMVEPDTAATTLASLTEAGVRVSLDDFGSGYTSIDDVTRLPIALLKVDRSLVSQVRTERGHALVSSMQLMGDALGVDTVAEGVETVEELALVMAIGCTYVQGYLLGRPVAAADVDHGRRAHMDDELLARRAADARER